MRTPLPASKAISSPHPRRLEKIMEPFLNDLKFQNVIGKKKKRLVRLDYLLDDINPRSEAHINIYNEYNKNLYKVLDELKDKKVIYEEAIARDLSGKSYLGTDPFDDNHLLAIKHKEQFEQIRNEEFDLNSGPVGFEEFLEEFHELDDIVFFPLAPFPVPYRLVEKTKKEGEGYVRKFIREPALWEPIEETNEKMRRQGKWHFEDFQDEEAFPSPKKAKYKFSESVFNKDVAKKLDYDEDYTEAELREFTFYNRQIFKEAYRNIHEKISPDNALPIYSRKSYFAYKLIEDIYKDMKEDIGVYHELDNMRNEDRPEKGICEDSALSILTNAIKSEIGVKPD